MSVSNSFEYLKDLMESIEFAYALYAPHPIVRGELISGATFIIDTSSDTGIYNTKIFHPKFLCRNYDSTDYGTPYYIFKNKFCNFSTHSVQRMRTTADKYWYVKAGLWLDKDFRHVMSVQIVEGTSVPVLVVNKNFVYGEDDSVAKFILNKIIKKSHELGYDIHLIDSSFLDSKLFSVEDVNGTTKKQLLEYIKNEPESKTCRSHTIFGNFFQV